MQIEIVQHSLTFVEIRTWEKTVNSVDKIYPSEIKITDVPWEMPVLPVTFLDVN